MIIGIFSKVTNKKLIFPEEFRTEWFCLRTYASASAPRKLTAHQMMKKLIELFGRCYVGINNTRYTKTNRKVSIEILFTLTKFNSTHS